MAETLEQKLYKNADISREKIVFNLSKQELLDPQLTQILRAGFLSAIGPKIILRCTDKNLAFSKEERAQLIKNNELLKENNGEMQFVESIRSATEYSHGFSSPTSVNLSFHRVIIREANLTFEEVLGANKEIATVAETIKRIAKEHNLSPFETYMVCYFYAQNIEYHLDLENAVLDQSLIKTVNGNTGCCVGQAAYLTTLLNMVGINSCSISVLQNDCQVAVLKKLQEANADKPYLKKIKELQSEEVIKKFIDGKLSRIPKENYYLLGPLIKDMTTDHAITLVYMEDEKYSMKCGFLADPTETSSNYGAFCQLDDQTLKEVFGFSGLSKADHNLLLDEFFKKLDIQDNPELSAQKEEEYFKLAKDAILVEIFKKVDKFSKKYKYLKNQKLKLKISKFLSDLDKCQSFGDIKRLFTAQIKQKTLLGDICRKLYPEIINDKDGMFTQLKNASKYYSKMQSLASEQTLTQEKLTECLNRAQDVYEYLFDEDDIEKGE